MSKGNITTGLILGIAATIIVFLGVKWLLQDNTRPELPKRADVKVDFKLALPNGKGFTRHDMTLICGRNAPMPGTKGFTFDIKKQAEVACQLAPRLLISGDFRCGTPDQSRPGDGWASVDGVVKGRRVQAQFSGDGRVGCEKQIQYWREFQRLWVTDGKPDKQGREDARRNYEQDQRLAKRLKARFRKSKRDAEERIRKQNLENQKYLAPDVKINR